MGAHTLNAVLNKNELSQSSAALTLISADTLLLFYARPCKHNEHANCTLYNNCTTVQRVLLDADMADWVDFQSCGYSVVTFALVIIGVLLNCKDGQSQSSVCVGKGVLELSFW